MLVLAVADLLRGEALRHASQSRLAVGARRQHDRQPLPVAGVLLAGERRPAQPGPAEDLVGDRRGVAGVEPPVVDVDALAVVRAGHVVVDRARVVPPARRPGCLLELEVVLVGVDQLGALDDEQLSSPHRLAADLHAVVRDRVLDVEREAPLARVEEEERVEGLGDREVLLAAHGVVHRHRLRHAIGGADRRRQEEHDRRGARPRPPRPARTPEREAASCPCAPAASTRTGIPPRRAPAQGAGRAPTAA